MKIFPRKLLRSRRQQQGIITAMAAVILVTAVIYVLAQTFGIIGTTSLSNAAQRDSVAAFFLAESGVERGFSVINAAADAGNMTNAICDGLTGTHPVGDRGGQFTYDSPVSVPATCGGMSSSFCDSCSFTARGSLGGSSRAIRVTISSIPNEGTAGCGNSSTLQMTVAAPGSYAFTHLAYRAKDDGTGCSGGIDTSNARIGTCTIGGVGAGNCNVSTTGDFWDLQSGGTNAVSSFGVSSTTDPLITGAYTIRTTFEVAGSGQARGSGTPVPRDYAQTGLLFAPLGTAVGFAGSYAGNTTTAATGFTGSVAADWNCQPSSRTTAGNMSRAARADALVYGFSSWPTNPSKILNTATLGIQPLHLLTRREYKRTETGPIELYSDIWFSYNRAYDSTVDGGVSAARASNGATFTATLGADLKGHTLSRGTTNCPLSVPSGQLCLQLDAQVTPGILSSGDTITGGSVSGTLGALLSGSANANNSVYVFNYSGSTINNNTLLIAKSAILRLLTAPSATNGGWLTSGDAIMASGGTTTYGILSNYAVRVDSPAALGLANSTYDLTGVADGATYVVSTGMISSSGSTITVKGSPNPSQTPLVGTAVAVWQPESGTGSFGGKVFIGTISGSTLTPATSVTLCNGDLLFGSGYKEPLPSTNDIGIPPITSVVTSGGCTNIGPFSVVSTKTIPSWTGTIVARTAVTAATNAASFTVSRPPTTNIRNAAVCGGVCALFFDEAGSLPNTTIQFTLAGFTSGDDWSSGFACLSGIQPDNIQTLGRRVGKRSSWTEVIQ